MPNVELLETNSEGQKRIKSVAETIVAKLPHPNRTNWSDSEREHFDSLTFDVASNLVPLYVEKLKWRSGIDLDPESGEIPEDGPGIIVYLHPRITSTLIVPAVVQRETGRPTTMIVKKTLADPNAIEGKGIAERTEKKTGRLNLINPSKPGGILRRGIVHVLNNSVNAIPVDRENPDEAFFEKVDQELDEGLLVATAYTISRQDPNNLSKPAKGGARMMQRNPDVPVIIMSITNVGYRTPNHPSRAAYVSILSDGTTMRDLHPDVDSVKALSKAQDYIVNGMYGLVSRQLDPDTIRRK